MVLFCFLVIFIPSKLLLFSSQKSSFSLSNQFEIDYVICAKMSYVVCLIFGVFTSKMMMLIVENKIKQSKIWSSAIECYFQDKIYCHYNTSLRIIWSEVTVLVERLGQYILTLSPLCYYVTEERLMFGLWQCNIQKCCKTFVDQGSLDTD